MSRPTVHHPGTGVVDARLATLAFWHQLEFFLPFDLQKQVLEATDADKTLQLLTPADLALPDDAPLWDFTPAKGWQLSGFDVYLGVFDKAELGQVMSRTLSEAEAHDQQERGELEGLTCTARVQVDAWGRLLLDDVAVSMAPWALGRVQSRGLQALDVDDFQADLAALKLALRTGGGGDNAGTTLRMSGLRALLADFQHWSGYQPAPASPHLPAVVIRARCVKLREPQAPEDDEPPAEAAAQDTEVTFLNSFLAQDIACALRSLRHGQGGAALQAYLGPRPAADRIDLYQPAGREHIRQALQPSRMNAGHWPDDAAHKMSLMQQFGINSVFARLGDAPGLFSINGPPGTGKTTLLRDLVAENLVRRARVLARCATAGAAFQGTPLTVGFHGVAGTCSVSVLGEELAGFEMVVASSNNAAVENISQDLPRSKALGPPDDPGHPEARRWRDTAGAPKVGYLQTVARNLAARNARGTYDDLGADDDPWGLIACALGNRGNRKAVVQALNGPKQPWPQGFDPARHQSLWTWRAAYSGMTFAQAQAAFTAADARTQALLLALDEHARLHDELAATTQAQFTAAETDALQQAGLSHAQAQQAAAGLLAEQASCRARLLLLKEQEKLLRPLCTPFWTWFTDRPAYDASRVDLKANRQAQRACLQRELALPTEITEAAGRVQAASDAVAAAQGAWVARTAAWAALQQRWTASCAKFPGATAPQSHDDLELDRHQIDGLWHSEAVNHSRSALFAAALQLQEAWLAEVLRKGGGLGGNVVALSHLLSGRRLQQPEAALALWRSLFMVVPVVSSTFASFARQFRDLGAQSLGWLFIDEAGQAVPQAAVGALWRAQRAVVVGDPLQIEPVFTVPLPLVEALAQAHPGLPADVQPHRVSVQRLADAANPLGACIDVGDEPAWIGSPLRVHRRCVDPMFSVANTIAYRGKMVFSKPDDPEARRPPAGSLDIGASAWVDLAGAATDKQVVPAQVALVRDALLALRARTGELPPVYVISPFKRIKEALLAQMADMPRNSGWRTWSEKHIGTVHTFQGKEESIVWLVLGCDGATAGAADWAAAKPNLLNVALTRAKHRFFAIGDAALWGGLNHFRDAGPGVLPRISPQQFLQQVGTAPVPPPR